jgi:hypothetical protein
MNMVKDLEGIKRRYADYNCRYRSKKTDESGRVWRKSLSNGYPLVMRKLTANSDLKF